MTGLKHGRARDVRRAGQWRLLCVAIAALAGAIGCSTTSPTNTTTTTTVQPTNHAPVLTSVTVTPSFGVAGVTTIAMAATATDADSDPLTFTWAFNGRTVPGASTSSTLTGDGPVTVGVTVSDGKGGTATDSRTVTVGTMTGTWSFTIVSTTFPQPCGQNPGEQPGVFTLTQSGTAVSGTIFFPGQFCGVSPQTGATFHDPASIDSTGAFLAPRISVIAANSFIDIALNGVMDSTGRKITGQCTGCNGVNVQSGFTLTKQ